MKKNGRTSRKPVVDVDLARILVARAEAQLATAKEMARAARRWRKEAKQAARRSRKQAKLAKREVNEAKLVLARAQARLARLNPPLVKARSRKTSENNAVAASVHQTPVRTAAVRSRAIVKTPILVPRLSEHKTTRQIVKGVKEIVAEQPDVPESQAPAVVHKDVA